MIPTIRYLSEKLAGTAVGFCVGLGLIKMEDHYRFKNQEKAISKTRQVGEKYFPSKEEIEYKYQFIPAGYLPNGVKNNQQAEKDLKSENYIICPPDKDFFSDLYITGDKTLPPCACEVVKEGILKRIEFLDERRKLFQNEPWEAPPHDNYYTYENLSKISQPLHQPAVFEARKY